MEAIIFALISYFTWGSGVFVEAIVARKLRWHALTFWGFLLSIILLSLYIPSAVKDLASLTLDILFLIFILGFMGFFLGTIFYYEALRIGNRALVGTIASSFPVVTVILSIIFLGDRVSIQQIIAIMIIFTGLFLSILDLKTIGSKFLDKGSFLALMTMISWGTYFTFIKIPVQKIGWFWPNYLTFFLFPLILLYMRFKKVRLEMPTKNDALIVIIVSVILVRIAELSYNYAITKGLVTVVASIAGANPTLFVILAFVFFKDPITKQQVVGIVTTLAGIVLLSLFSI